MLRTGNVYIDTQQWRAIKLNWSNELARALARAAQAGRISIKTTDILLGELRSHISQAATSYVAAIKSAESSKSVAFGEVRGALEQNVDFDLLSQRIERELRNAMGRYFEFCRVERLRYRDQTLDSVLARYFNGDPPFAGVKDKKHEFPDAIFLDTLEHWCRSNDEEMYVVSGDKGVIDFCENSEYLIPVQTLSALVREMNEGTPESEEMLRIIEAHRSQICEEIAACVSGLPVCLEDFGNDSASITNAGSDVTAAELILHPSEDDYIAYVTANLKLEVVAVGDDPGLWVKDERTGRKTYLHKEERRYTAVLDAAFRVGVYRDCCDRTRIDINFVEPVVGDSIQLGHAWSEGPSSEIVLARMAEGLCEPEIPF